MTLFVDGVGLLGPGLAGWRSSRAILAGEAPFQPVPFEAPRVDLLPPVERRRTGLPVKLAIWAGQDALAGTGIDSGTLSTVFTSSGGDGNVIHEICSTLACPEREVSPTRFHNSVHNAPAGYWGIATRSSAPSTSLCGHDWSFAAGLLEAAGQVAAGEARVLLIAYDAPYPEPLNSVRPVGPPFACALLLAGSRSAQSLARLAVRRGRQGLPTRIADARLEALRTGTPAARALPLLALLAGNRAGRVDLEDSCGAVITLESRP